MSLPSKIPTASTEQISKQDSNTHPSPSTKQESDYYEMYYDTTHKAPYYYHPKTGSSVWKLPEGAI